MSTHYFRFSHFRFGRCSAANARRSPLLERLLARADSCSAVIDWRLDAFRIIAPRAAAPPGVGAAIVFAERGCVDAASVFMATPVHYLAEMSNVRLAADGILSLRQSEADGLSADFNRVWSDAGIRLLAGRRAALFCVADRPVDATTRDPEDVLDRHIDNHLPIGAAAPRLRRLMSEIEMWLFEHAVNRSRIAAAAPVVNGLWLWGGGPALRSLPSIDGWSAGDDPYFNALAARPESHARSRATSGVIASGAEPETEEWREMESRWLRPSLADLTSGRIARLALSAGDRCFSVSARGRWRLWRRRRPWWECFE